PQFLLFWWRSSFMEPHWIYSGSGRRQVVLTDSAFSRDCTGHSIGADGDKRLARRGCNKALQADKDKLSCLLHSQAPRQLAFAASFVVRRPARVVREVEGNCCSLRASGLAPDQGL